MAEKRCAQFIQKQRIPSFLGWQVCAFLCCFWGAACVTPKEANKEAVFTDGAAGEKVIEISLPDEKIPEPWSSYDAHGDCFGRLDCDPVTGVVTRWEHNPVPIGQACASWVVYTCKKGCRKDGKNADFTGPPEAACEEGRAKVEGDPCESLVDCLPTHSTYDPVTSKVEGDPCESLVDCLPTHSTYDPVTYDVINTYLTCDTSQKKCVKADPPEVAGYMTSCQIPASKSLAHSHGYRRSSFCPHGLCLIAGGTDFCVFQGCTIACSGDHECPQGSLCRTDLSGLATQPTQTISGICKPGMAGTLSKKGMSCY